MTSTTFDDSIYARVERKARYVEDAGANVEALELQLQNARRAYEEELQELEELQADPEYQPSTDEYDGFTPLEFD